ncbi:MAG: DUF488 domain-containing protein [Bacteroidetes bacterium]|nr:DUF488 domain-containing protein [Bacteroidota bacterium]MBS1630377.1 DUF488 domain-containing protein [Bacteroidota bacterium]
MPPEIWTIGHSTRSFEDFAALLQSFQITLLADVRSFPGSRKFPQFNEAFLADHLPEKGIDYASLKLLGGRRKALPESQNKGWQHEAFRGYADYMATPGFEQGLAALKQLAHSRHIAYMCSEALWWRCHRRLISDRLVCDGWQVWHIMALGKTTLHRLAPPAMMVAGKLCYPGNESLF